MRELDTRGMRCPKPVIELAKLAKELPEGGSVTVLSDDPAAPGDIAAWCRMRGHELLDQRFADGVSATVLRVHRTPAAAAAATPPPAGAGTPPG